jgi:hypothetical protein
LAIGIFASSLPGVDDREQTRPTATTLEPTHRRAYLDVVNVTL